ncbi:hypothetical protein I9W82_004626 [Candida metapsilosis]|uniref:Amidohydrolase-related domain-containing protein n=1 Tax=Candida metapsilosis TaxID=273372 RepID=A0A8H7Z878_9ASCO|nr:hypothetical protein I9W82_004626 [Candida metapsilosis]
MSRRIDTHAHVVPPFYKDWLVSKGITAGGMAIPTWTEETCLAQNAKNGIETSILSVSTPGVNFGNNFEEAKVMARRVNEFCYELVKKNPRNFGYFATLSLPDVETSIIEAEYALDHLKADGIVLLSNVGDLHLGDPSFEPLMEVLNKRNAVVFIHPSALATAPLEGIPPYVVDFLLCTVRAAVNIVKHNWLEKFPNVKFILSHAGGFLPYAVDRVAVTSHFDESPEKLLASLKKFYFDTALSGPHAMGSLLEFADPDKITFGSDWPYASAPHSLWFGEHLKNNEKVNNETKERINRKNAEALFPRLAQYN